MLREAFPAGREARRILLGNLFSAIGQGLTLPFLLVYLTEVRGLNAGTVGLLIAWTGGVSLLVAPVGGWLVDRFGARYAVIPMLVVVAVGNASLAIVDSWGSALVSLTLVAVGGSVIWPAGTAVLASLVTEEERQRTFGLSFTLLNLGIGIGGLLAGTFVDTARPGTFQVLYLGDALSYVVPLAIMLSLPRVGRRVVSEPARGQERGGYGRVLRDRVFVAYFVFGLVLTTVGYAQIEVGFTGFAITAAHVPARVIGWAFAGNTLLIVVAQLFVLRWLEGRSRTHGLALVGVIFAVSWSVLGLAGLAGGAGQVVPAAAAVIACSVIFAMGETVMSPVLPAITNALAPDELRGRYNAVGSMFWGLSAVIGPATAGPLLGAGRGGLWLVLVIAGSLSATVLALRLHRRLTPAQDGRAPAKPAWDATPLSVRPPVEAVPVDAAPAGVPAPPA